MPNALLIRHVKIIIGPKQRDLLQWWNWCIFASKLNLAADISFRGGVCRQGAVSV